MTSEYVWVVAYEGSVENYQKFIRCARNNSMIYVENYKNEGFSVEIITDDELDDMIKCGKFKKR